MEQNIWNLALERAGFSTLEQFMERRELSSREAAQEALMPWVLGYDLWRIRQGDTYSRIAGETGASVEAIRAANPGAVPGNLTVGAFLVVPLPFPVVPILWLWQAFFLCRPGIPFCRWT